jgi:hypothetical protein
MSNNKNAEDGEITPNRICAADEEMTPVNT